MKALSRLFRTKAAVPARIKPASLDALPGEVDAACAAAVITVRSFEDSPSAKNDCRTIIEFQGRRSLKFDRAELGRFFATEWPDLSESHIARAILYLNNRITAQARRMGEAQAAIDSSRKRWSASEW